MKKLICTSYKNSFIAGNEVFLRQGETNKTKGSVLIITKTAYTEYDFYKNYEDSFKHTEIGRIKTLLPLWGMAISFGLIEERSKSLRVKRGRKGGSLMELLNL